jgi:hypothetical protein
MRLRVGGASDAQGLHDGIQLLFQLVEPLLQGVVLQAVEDGRQTLDLVNLQLDHVAKPRYGKYMIGW